MMEEKDKRVEQDEIFSRALKAGRRTYFFDVRSTRGGDYYLTIAESKKYYHNENGEERDPNNFTYKKHKIFLYKEDFSEFKELFNEVTKFIIDEKGEEVISERHQKDFKKPSYDEENKDGLSDVKFEDL